MLRTADNRAMPVKRLREDFRRDGYVVVPDVIDSTASKAMRHCLERVASLFLEKTWVKGDWSDESLDQALIALRERDPNRFSMLYDTLQVSVPLQQLVCAPSVSRVAATLLDDDVTGLAATGQMIRVDTPNDVRNRLDWHQEISYYDQNTNPANGLVVWIPMRTTRPEDGSIFVCPRSHELGPLRPEPTAKADYKTSEQLRAPQEAVSKFEHHQILAEQGSAVFFHMSLLHSSGTNTSSRIRFSAGVRFHRILTGDFLPGRFLYQPNAYAKTRRLSA